MPLIGDTILPAASARVWPHAVGNSALFDDVGDSLTRTPVGEGDRRTWTFSTWIKVASATDGTLLSAGDDYLVLSDGTGVRQMNLVFGGVNTIRATTPTDDPTAHGHIVCAVDMTLAEENERIAFYYNNQRLPVTVVTAIPAQNMQGAINAAVEHAIGRRVNEAWAEGAYLSESILVDGQALTPDAFGQWSDKVIGLWMPKQYEGTYGTNGFHLDFSNAAALGGDVSGNNNDWTVNSAPTQTLDTPTNNYATLNPLIYNSGTFSHGNLRVTNGNRRTLSTIRLPSAGRYYVEVDGVDVAPSSTYNLVGISRDDTADAEIKLTERGDVFIDGVYTGINIGTWVNGDVTCMDINCDANTLRFRVNDGSWSQAFNMTADSSEYRVFVWAYTTGSILEANFGATGFIYTPPEGGLPLCSANLPEPAILRSNAVADVVLREGTGAEASVTSLEFRPDFVSIKDRDNSRDWALFDSERGVTKYLSTNAPDAETTDANSLTTRASTGYTLGTSSLVNHSGASFLDLCLKAGVEQGFEVLTYAGDGVTGRQITHSLGKAPTFMIVKNVSLGATGWVIYHAALGATKHLVFETSAAITAAYTWNDTEPTSTTFTLGANAGVNGDEHYYVAYLFTDSDIFRAFSYTGNGNADGPFVHLGGRPLAIPFLKGVGTTNWFNFDAARNLRNPITRSLLPSASNGEGTDACAHFTSNGMKVKTALAGTNTASQVHVGLAILQSTKYSNAF